MARWSIEEGRLWFVTHKARRGTFLGSGGLLADYPFTVASEKAALAILERAQVKDDWKVVSAKYSIAREVF